jgi:SET domain
MTLPDGVSRRTSARHLRSSVHQTQMDNPSDDLSKPPPASTRPVRAQITARLGPAAAPSPSPSSQRPTMRSVRFLPSMQPASIAVPRMPAPAENVNVSVQYGRFGSLRIPVWLPEEQTVLSGKSAPKLKDMEHYLAKHPYAEMYAGQDNAEAAAGGDVTTASSFAKLHFCVTADVGTKHWDERRVPIKRNGVMQRFSACPMIRELHMMLASEPNLTFVLPSASVIGDNRTVTTIQQPGYRVALWDPQGKTVTRGILFSDVELLLSENPHLEFYCFQDHTPGSLQNFVDAKRADLVALRRRMANDALQFKSIAGYKPAGERKFPVLIGNCLIPRDGTPLFKEALHFLTSNLGARPVRPLDILKCASDKAEIDSDGCQVESNALHDEVGDSGCGDLTSVEAGIKSDDNTALCCPMVMTWDCASRRAHRPTVQEIPLASAEAFFSANPSCWLYRGNDKISLDDIFESDPSEKTLWEMSEERREPAKRRKCLMYDLVRRDIRRYADCPVLADLEKHLAANSALELFVGQELCAGKISTAQCPRDVDANVLGINCSRNSRISPLLDSVPSRILLSRDPGGEYDALRPGQSVKTVNRAHDCDDTLCMAQSDLVATGPTRKSDLNAKMAVGSAAASIPSFGASNEFIRSWPGHPHRVLSPLLPANAREVDGRDRLPSIPQLGLVDYSLQPSDTESDAVPGLCDDTVHVATGIAHSTSSRPAQDLSLRAVNSLSPAAAAIPALQPPALAEPRDDANNFALLDDNISPPGKHSLVSSDLPGHTVSRKWGPSRHVPSGAVAAVSGIFDMMKACVDRVVGDLSGAAMPATSCSGTIFPASTSNPNNECTTLSGTETVTIMQREVVGGSGKRALKDMSGHSSATPVPNSLVLRAEKALPESGRNNTDTLVIPSKSSRGASKAHERASESHVTGCAVESIAVDVEERTGRSAAMAANNVVSTTSQAAAKFSPPIRSKSCHRHKPKPVILRLRLRDPSRPALRPRSTIKRISYANEDGFVRATLLDSKKPNVSARIAKPACKAKPDADINILDGQDGTMRRSKRPRKRIFTSDSESEGVKGDDSCDEGVIDETVEDEGTVPFLQEQQPFEWKGSQQLSHELRAELASMHATDRIRMWSKERKQCLFGQSAPRLANLHSFMKLRGAQYQILDVHGVHKEWAKTPRRRGPVMHIRSRSPSSGLLSAGIAPARKKAKTQTAPDDPLSRARASATREANRLGVAIFNITGSLRAGDPVSTYRRSLENELERVGGRDKIVGRLRDGIFVESAADLLTDLRNLDVYGMFDMENDGLGLPTLSAIRLKLESGELLGVKATCDQFRSVLASFLDFYPEGTVYYCAAEQMFYDGEQVILRFCEINHGQFVEESGVINVQDICEAAQRAAAKIGIDLSKLPTSYDADIDGNSTDNSLVGSEVIAASMELVEDAVQLRSNYRDAKGYSFMGKRESAKVFGLPLYRPGFELMSNRFANTDVPNAPALGNGGLYLMPPEYKSSCHACSRRIDDSASYALRCANQLYGMCQNIFCWQCLRTAFRMEDCQLVEERSNNNWICFHCRSECSGMMSCANASPDLDDFIACEQELVRLEWAPSSAENNVSFGISIRKVDGTFDELGPLVPGVRQYCAAGKELWILDTSLRWGVYHCFVFVDRLWFASFTTQVLPDRKAEGETNPTEDSHHDVLPQGSPGWGRSAVGHSALTRRQRIVWDLAPNVSQGEDLPISLASGPIRECSRTEGYDWRAAKLFSTVMFVGSIQGSPSNPVTNKDCNLNPIICSSPTSDRRPRYPVPRWGDHLGMSMKNFDMLRNGAKYDDMIANSLWGIVTGKSAIHGIGLFTLIGYSKGDFVIEYAGELIRTPIADLREAQYEAAGLGTYLFKVTDEHIVDATVHSNRARFTNHSCDPNMAARVVNVRGRDLVMFTATRRIPPLAELTFDYQLPLEERKLSCNCRSFRCQGSLN